MCLILSPNHARENADYIKNLKGTFIAYKVLDTNSEGKFVSPWYDQTKWVKGKTTTSNRENITDTPRELMDNEVYDMCVFQGLHLYRTREDARKGKARWSRMGKQIWKVEVNPKDVVAVGLVYLNYFDNRSALQSIVVHKAKLLERVR